MKIAFGCLIGMILAFACGSRALAIAEFCPAVLGDAHMVKDGGSTLFSTTLNAEGPRTVTADAEAQTENGWYTFAIPSTTIVRQEVKYATSQLTFTRFESTSALFYVRFPAGAGNVIRWWITDAASTGDALMGWDAKGKVGCGPNAQWIGPTATPNPAAVNRYLNFLAKPVNPPSLDFDRMPGAQDVVLTVTPTAAKQFSCDKPFSNSRVMHAVAPQWPLGYGTTVQLETLVRVWVDADGSLADASLFQPSGARAFDDAAVEAARRSTYAAGRAFCEPAPGNYIFRALFNP